MKTDINTAMMEVAIARYFGTRKHIIVPNVSWGFFIHECDLLLIRKTGYAIEVEIKRTIADLRRDFKKKHQHNDNRIRELFYALPDYLLEKGMSLIPPHAGIISVYSGHGGIRAGIIRMAPTNDKARKLTEKEMLMIARLGVLRVWNLKEKLLKLNKE